MPNDEKQQPEQPLNESFLVPVPTTPKPSTPPPGK